jgi:uncharacterized peroxidase-related enzyme
VAAFFVTKPGDWSQKMKFPIHTPQSAPTEAKDTLNKVIQAWGFLPNLGAVIAEFPAALELLWVGYAALTSKGTLTAAEQQLIAVAASRENQCAYCVAAHSTMALGAKLEPDVLRALRDGQTINDRKLAALSLLTARLVRQRGTLAPEERQEFVDAGYTPGQLLEVVGWIAVKTLTNYVNHMVQTPVDAQWMGQSWVPLSEVG